MKTKFFKTVFPLVAFIFAIAGAFAFKPAPSSSFAQHIGAKKVGLTECQMTSTQCTDVNTTIICRDASNAPLYKFVSSTSCPQQLWRP